MGPTAGMYVIYDKVNQVPMLLDEATYRKVEHIVTSGRPSLEGIDYQVARQKMRAPIVDKTKLKASEVKPDDLIAIYDKVNAAVMAIPRWAYEKVKHHYDEKAITAAAAVAAVAAPSKKPAAAAAAPAPLSTSNWKTEEELDSVLRKEHPILNYRPSVPKLAPPPATPCAVGLVACGACGLRSLPAAEPTLIVPEPAMVVVPSEGPLAALRPPSSSLAKDSQQKSQTRKSVAFAEPLAAVKVVVVADAVTEEGPEIFDKVNNCFMKVPREIYLKVKHFYKDDQTFLYDRVNDCPMKVPWSTYMKVKMLYGVGFVPEVAARPGDEDLFINIEDRVNGGKMRVPWNIWLKVRHYYKCTALPIRQVAQVAPIMPTMPAVPAASAASCGGPEIFDKVNNCFMPVPREIYLKVKHHYNDDKTYLYDRVNDCPMKVPWSTYMKVKKLYGAGFVPEVAARPGDEDLFVNIEDRVNGGKMRIPWNIWLKVRHHYDATPLPAREEAPAAAPWDGPEIFDKVNKCFMPVSREIYLKVKHYYKNDETYLYDRVNNCPMKVSWSTYMKVKKYYAWDSGEFVPEVAAHPGDDTLYLNIKDRVNGGKMRVPWKIWLQVRRWYLVDIWDRVNCTWMTVPREVYLKVKHFYDKDTTFLYDRVNDCPMQVPWHNYCKVRKYYTDIAVDAWPGDTTLMISIPDRVNYTTMRVPWHHYRRMNYMLRLWEDNEPRTWIWDKVNLCPMEIKWKHYLKVAHHFGYTVAARQGDAELFTWIWDRVNQNYMRVPWRVMEKVKHYYANDETFIWDKVNKCEMKVPWNVFMDVRHHYGFTIDSRPGDEQLHHPIWDRVNNCWMRVPRPIYLKVKKYYAESFTFIFDRVNQCPMKVSWPNFMKVYHYFLDFYPRLACRPGDETLFVFIHDKVNLCKMRVSWENYLKVKKYVEIPKYFAFGAKK